MVLADLRRSAARSFALPNPLEAAGVPSEYTEVTVEVSTITPPIILIFLILWYLIAYSILNNEYVTKL